MLTRASFIALAATALLGMNAFAQAPGMPKASPAEASPQAPAAAGQIQPREVATPAESAIEPAVDQGPALSSSVDSELQRLAATQRQAEVLSAEVQLLNLQGQVSDLRNKNAGNRAGTTGLPQLVGMISTKKGVAAEFLAGGALLQVAQGDWVSAEWRLSKVLTNGVEITRADGRERHTLMFGGTAQRAATAYEAR